MENEFNISELKYKSGDIVLVHWDNRYKIKTPTIHKDVAAGNGGTVATSTNGVDWTVTQLTSSYNLYGICPA